jgi:hypothetical protein
MREKIEEALAGGIAFAIFRDEAVLELRPLTSGGGWILADVHVAQNALVRWELRRDAAAKCVSVGITSIDYRTAAMSLRSYKRFAGAGWGIPDD